MVGALLGAIVGVEIYKAMRGIRGSTGGVFVAIGHKQKYLRGRTLEELDSHRIILLGGTTALALTPKHFDGRNWEAAMANDDWQRTACILCYVNCGLEVQTEGRKITRVRGDPKHPANLGRLAQRAGAGEIITFETRHRRKDGTAFPVEIRTGTVKQGGELFYLALARDISERKRAEELLAHNAFHDGLTNLPNRVLFLDRLQRHFGGQFRCEAQIEKAPGLGAQLAAGFAGEGRHRVHDV